MCCLLEELVRCKKLPANTADKVKSQFIQLCHDPEMKNKFKEFNLSSQRLDYAALIGSNSEFCDLWRLVKISR